MEASRCNNQDAGERRHVHTEGVGGERGNGNGDRRLETIFAVYTGVIGPSQDEDTSMPITWKAGGIAGVCVGMGDMCTYPTGGLR